MSLTFVDLFSGIGGFHQAMKNMGIECVFASDNDTKCNEVYELNYGIKPHGDITKIDASDIPNFDVLCAGFPCFVSGTLVLTDSGYKKIENVTLFDKLLTHTGKFQRIMNVQKKRYDGEFYAIKSKYGQHEIICTPEHPFYVLNNEKLEWINANELTNDMHLTMKVNENAIVPEFLEDIESWYIMGYFLGDGWIQNNHICFIIHKTDVVERLSCVLNMKKCDHNQYVCTDVDWWYIFNELNDKKIPEWIQDAPIEYVKMFLNGYIDSDADRVWPETVLGIQRLYMKPLKDYAYSKIHTINKYVADEIVYNFEVEHDNSYTVYNTIVHNCQPFSKAGHQRGFEDSRGNLFFEIERIARHHMPKYMILENVRNLYTHDSGNTWNVIRNAIDELGYYTYEKPLILNTLNFNVPQNRERVIIMCKRKDLGELPELPEFPKKNLTNTLDSIMTNETGTLSAKMKDVEKVWNSFINVLKTNEVDMPKFPIWTDWWDKEVDPDDPFYLKYENWILKNKTFYDSNEQVLSPWLMESRSCSNWAGSVRKFEWQAGHLGPNDSMNTVLWTARGSGIRVKRPDYAPTLVAMSMIPVYGPLSRPLTPRELLRLQCFSDDFVYSKDIYKQIGNAVNVKMIEKSARFLIYDEALF